MPSSSRNRNRPSAPSQTNSDTAIDPTSLTDPERPVLLDELASETPLEEFVPRSAKLLAIAAAVVALAAAWRYTPMSGLLSPDVIIGWARVFANRPWAPWVLMLIYTPACLVMFPRSLITLGAVVAFGPWLGCSYALAGILFAALLTYSVGHMLPRGAVRNLAGAYLNSIMDILRRRGLLAMTALRLVPIAPFAVINVVAGAVHIKLWHFMLGSLLGILPGTLAATIFGNHLEAALRNHSRISYGLLAAVVFALIVLTLVVRAWLSRQRRTALRPGVPGN